jgi:hypothetical protein
MLSFADRLRAQMEDPQVTPDDTLLLAELVNDEQLTFELFKFLDASMDKALDILSNAPVQVSQQEALAFLMRVQGMTLARIVGMAVIASRSLDREDATSLRDLLGDEGE